MEDRYSYNQLHQDSLNLLGQGLRWGWGMEGGQSSPPRYAWLLFVCSHC